MASSEADRTERLAHDWATIWQSELAARGADPELGQMLQAIFSTWLNATGSGGQVWSAAHDRPHSAGPAAASGTPPAAAAPDPRPTDQHGDAIDELRRRVAELEGRLAAPDTPIPARPKRTRRKPAG